MAAFTAASALFNLSKATPLIVKQWKGVTLGLLLAVVVYQNTFPTRIILWADTIPYLREQVVLRDRTIENIANANTVLSDAINNTNTEIEKARSTADQLARDKNQLQSELQKRREVTRQQSLDILNAPVPKSSDGAIQLLRDVIPHLQYPE